jgi:hypothetical protein
MDFDPNEDFEFGGEMPDSDEEKIYAAEKEYDTLNDETFGGDVVEPIPEDLSAFAANSLALKLEDTSFNDEPSSSSVASQSKQRKQQRPDDLGKSFTNSRHSKPSANNAAYDQQKAYKSQQEAVRGTQSLWGQNSPKNYTNTAFNIPFSSSSGYNRAPSPPKDSSSSMTVLRSIPGGALTLDEIENEQLMRTGSVHLGNTFPLTPGDRRTSINAPHPSNMTVINPIPHTLMNNQQQPQHSDWIHPPLSAEEQLKMANNSQQQKKTVVTVEELERKILSEFEEKKSNRQPENNEQQHGMNPMMPQGMYPGMPPMNPMQMAQMQQYFQWQQAMAAAAAMAAASGSTTPPMPNMLPPGFPPPNMMPPYGPPPGNPAMFAAMMSRMQFSGLPPPQASGFGMPPPPQMNQQQRSQSGTPNNSGIHAQGAWPMNSPLNNRNNPASGCPSPAGSTMSKRTRKEGMPSMRTITDFACDPYAGFMSKKEREWLIKIQLIQCLGTGDKYQDDYYYTCWKKNNTLEKIPDSWKQPKIKSKYYNLEETYPSVYNPPTFSGVLGKPSNATTTFPRQVLDVVQPVEDDVESIVGSSSREINKRKLRTILLSIENGYLMQLECDDLLRKVPSVDADEAGVLLNEIHLKLNSIYNTIMDEGHIPTTMVITKGRRLCIRIMSLATSQLKAQIISNVFNTLRKFARKVSILPHNDFIQASLTALTEIKENDLKEFFVKTEAERFQDTLIYSTFSQNLFTALLIALAKRSIDLNIFCPSSSIVKFLQSDRKMYNGLGNSFNEIFQTEDLTNLKTWLQKSMLCSSGNVAGCFLVCLREKNY